MMSYLGMKLLFGYNHRTAYLDHWFKNAIVTMPYAVDTGVMVVTKSQLAAFKPE
jgi:hypothetical protein